MFHRWVSTDVEEHDSCLVCGGMWEYNAADSYHHSADGSDAVRCTGDTLQVHGYAGEQWCDACDKPNLIEDHCEHYRTDCNCLFCDS